MNGVFTQGTGTVDDPYFIEDVYDFCAVKNNDDGTTTYYKLTRNINFNDHVNYKSGISVRVFSANKAIIDCDGKEIRNIVNKYANTVFSFSKIINGSLPNIVLQTGEAANYGLFQGTFENCSLSVMLSNAYPCGLGSSTTYFKNCTVNFGGASYGGGYAMYFTRLNFERCHIHFDNAAIDYFEYGCIRSGTFNNVYFTGKITARNVSSNNKVYPIYSATFSNIFFAIDITGYYNTNNEIFDISSSGSSNTNIFIKDIIRNGKEGTTWSYSTEASRNKWISTEQALTPGYLPSIGFPVIQAGDPLG
ncbi:MAG: hypothetical protein MJZ03_00215 [archaeon]|nr:hypothetical protein [archaeon]